MPTRALPKPPAVARILERVTSAARRHGMFEPRSRVVVAVSGGADSVCLLHALVRLRRLLKIEPICFHFDHRLRPGSDREATYVRRQADGLGVEFVLRTATSGPKRGESREAWARIARYGALHRVVEETGSRAAAVGHTADDQAETILLALLRGGGLEAVGGMEPVTPPVVRPLLEVTRGETEAFCRALRLRPRRDPMNEDRAFLRVVVRKDLLPALEAAAGRGVRSTLVRTAAILREDAVLLRALAGEAAERLVVAVGPDERLLGAADLGATPRPIATRVIRGVLLDLGLVPDAAHVIAVLGLADGRVGRRAILPGGLMARRDREYVRLLRSSPRGHQDARAQTETDLTGEGSDGRTDRP